MSQPRRLTFAVSTTLLTASLATGVAGCKKDEKTVNVHPDEVHTNPGPQDEPEVDGGDEIDPADGTVDADEAVEDDVEEAVDADGPVDGAVDAQ